MKNIMNVHLSLLKKIRCRFLDRSTGTPVPGVVASLSVKVGDPPNNSFQLPVATLCTDATGYVSFDLKPLIELGLGSASGFFISVPKFGLTNYDLLGSFAAEPTEGTEHKGKKPTNVSGSAASSIGFDLINVAAKNTEKKKPPCIVFPVYIETQSNDERESDTANCEPTRLPAIQSPDICDYKVSPFSFVTPTALKLGNDCCEVLLPSSQPVQQYRFYKIAVQIDDAGANDATIDNIPLTRGVNVSGALRPPESFIKFGEILEYQQDWYSLGHSLGEIKYSLPLAPGESTQLAVIDWSRDDRASRTDQIRATEFLDHDSRRDRAIEETVDAALKEEQGGNSHFGGTTGTASGQTYGTGMWTGNHAFGGGISYSYGKRNVEGESLQDIHDRVRQASSYVRSLNSTVIVQGSQSESNRLQTRRVANHNHCHALTIQYYEVLRHYRMSTKFSGRREAVLIPFEPFPFNIGKDSWTIALRFRTVLEQTLLDPSLGKCFEALIRLHLASSVYDAPISQTSDAPTKKTPISEIEDRMTLKASEGKGKELKIKNLKKGDTIKITASGLLAMSGSGGPGSAGVTPNGFNQVGRGNFPYLAEPKDLRHFSLIYKTGYTAQWQQGSEQFEVIADKDGDMTIIFGVNTLPNGFADFGVVGAESWTVAYKYPSREVDPTPVDPGKEITSKDLPFRKSDDELCSARLLRHLQDNQGYYNGAVWMMLDAVERRLYLEQALQGHQDILAGIDDRPLAISGNYVAFQYGRKQPEISIAPVPPSGTIDDDLHVPIENIVTLPTRGLFAEAQMGHCNSCEERDVTRMWDWKEMTTETPPDISGISPGPKGTATSITPGQLPSNVIQITTPQAAPDPTGLANALGVLNTPDIFRDMAGLDKVSKLLGEMVKDATDANTKAMANQAQIELEKLKAGNKSGGGGDGGQTPGKQTPAERFENLQVAKEAAKAAKELGWDDKQTADITEDIVGGTGTGTLKGMIETIVNAALTGAKPSAANLPAQHPTLAERAELIANEPILVKAYQKFQDKTWKWWFSPNNKLAGAVSKPAGLTSWNDWDNLRWQQRSVLADIEGLDVTSLARNAGNLTKLTKVLAEWPDNYYAVFQSGTTEETNTCNLFLGDALTLDSREQMRAGGKYYSAQQVYQGNGGFRAVNTFNVSVGDIACWGPHVEIVTKVNYADDTFCSRGGYRTPIGAEICEANKNDGRRRLTTPNLRFMRVE